MVDIFHYPFPLYRLFFCPANRVWGHIIHGPGFNRSEKIDRMVSLLDLPSTILDCAQIPVPADFQRFSLKRLVQGEAGEWPEVIFMQISEN